MRHLGEKQRYLIFKLLQDHRMQSEIARILEVDRSTVSREIRRNSVNGKYRPKTAEILSISRRRECHKHYKYGQDTWDEVSDMIRQDYSPEQVSGRLRRLGKPAPSTECIYQYVWEQMAFGKTSTSISESKARNIAREAARIAVAAESRTGSALKSVRKSLTGRNASVTSKSTR